MTERRFETETTTSPLKIPWFPWIGRKPFYGWVIVAAGNLVTFTGGLANLGFATYLVPLQQQFGWSRAVLAGPRSMAQLETAVLGPIQGFLVDKFGPRINLAIGAFIMGLGFIMFTVTTSLPMYYVSSIVIALGNSLQGYLVMTVAINHWFRRKRTKANAILLLGFYVAGIVGVPALVLIQTTMGWRTSAFLTSLFIWAVALPCALFFRRSPETYGLLPDGDIHGASSPAAAGGHRAVEEFDFTLRDALRTRTFWLLAIGQAIGNLGMSATGVHLFLHLEQGVGLSRATTALVWSVANMAGIPSVLIGGFTGDQWPKNLLLGAFTVILALSTLVLGLATSLPMAMVFAVLYGIQLGLRPPVMVAMQGEYFGRKSQGIIRGWLALVSLPFTMVAPVLVGYMADIQGSYRMAFTVLSFVSLVGAALIFLAVRPKPPASNSR